jgi:hypothetical protein
MGVAPESMFGYLQPGIDSRYTTRRSSSPVEGLDEFDEFIDSCRKYEEL